MSDNVTGIKTDYTREELIKLCEKGIVPQHKWGNRDSHRSQYRLGHAWALLKAGCDFEVKTGDGSGCHTNEDTIWIEIKAEGFDYHEGYSPLDGDDRDDYLDTETFYIPTKARLKKRKGEDWY